MSTQSQSFFVTGTDTDVGKTVASAWAALHLGAGYWKPVQCGLEGETDIEVVRRLTGLPDEHIFAPQYELPEPLSPHEAAKRAGVRIDMARLTPPSTDRPLLIEGAGGLMVPLNEDDLVIDFIARLGLPVILVCRSALGTINHTLLSLEALRARDLSVAGVIINGPSAPHNRTAIKTYGRVRVIAEIGWLTPLTREALVAIPAEIDLSKAGAAT